MIPERIQEQLLPWYEEHKRSLPWGEDPTPYHVWISEIMLQQTRVEAVKEYYRRFLTVLPTIRDLALCPEDRLLKLWEGLGYYNRVRNMQKAARIIEEEYGGRIPRDYDRILKLPGIGSYTAGAVSSIAYGMKKPAVDGNVLRVISRMTENEGDILKQSVKRQVEQELEQIMPAEDPGAFNQGLMEIGATVCLPNGKPLCGVCPFQEFCQAHLHGRELEFPKKAPKKKRRIEERTVFLILSGNEYVIRKRDEGGLLGGMYEFPNTEGKMSPEEVQKKVEDKGLIPLYIKEAGKAKHIFSHIEWHMTGYLIKVAEPDEKTVKDLIFVSRKETKKDYAIPSAFSTFRKYIEEEYKK